jgi:hypothetical protein
VETHTVRDKIRRRVLILLTLLFVLFLYHHEQKITHEGFFGTRHECEDHRAHWKNIKNA